MQWTKPDFQEITLAMEVTAYVNTDDPAATPGPVIVQEPKAVSPSTNGTQRTTDN
jgi:coenzyme PQQ precursor peptide PqqA